ncbi:UPF0182 family membrane protein [Acidicapsa acidisoli]|uniref:UPF0182 family membrane protein n=1 Tax=Acidicapsa acidisoli TaxID=1615681 RepID=UPI0021E0AEF3|nr:UPF0182 family protein [Acidicapsa acidisoli]
MPETIDWPQDTYPTRKSRRKVIFFVAVVAVILFGSRTALSYFVEALWFRSLGYGGVFAKSLGLQWGIFAAFAVVTFLVLYGTFGLLRRAHYADLPSGHTIIIAGQPVKLSVEPVIRVLAVGVSLLVAGISGAAMMAEWPALALFWYAPQASGKVADPIFGMPLNFYLFTLPAWHILLNWLLMLAVLPCIIAGLFLLITSGANAALGALDGHRVRYGLSATRWRGLSIAVAFLLLVAALREYVGRFDLLFDPHTIFQGVSYTDAHVSIIGMLVISIALVLGAVIAAVSAVQASRSRLLVAAILPAAVCYVVFAVVGWYVGNFVVKPNELVREQPYISNNIEMTRQAFGLDKFQQREFPAETTVGATDPANNQATLQNIRLWDWHALQDTLRQIQEIRTYYDFPDIDIDRYEIDGKKREVMLAARELNVDKLPESSRNWINDKLIYTHGYGITMNPVNGFTSEGLPTLMLSNMPVQSTVSGLDVKRPEIYFGEMTNTDVYVKTRQQEFNYPQGQSNSLTSYEGTGGIVLGGFLRRILIAIDRNDLGKLPFSDDVNSASRLLMRRNIRDRVSALAPFLTFEQDPYIVLGNDGRLRWVIDAFTTSDNYPYSSHYRVDDQSINYLRNSVKAVIDAYDGTTTFYVFDDQDPILATYRQIFPDLFKDRSTMPAGLGKHVRYPELLLKTQAEVYGLYHMTNPEVFYNREDLWTVAAEVGLGDSGEQTTMAMQPNFVLMKLPGDDGEEFVEILPFTPANRNNLIGWIAGRSDGANYGTAVVYDFPKTKLVDGPLQIEARIDQNAQLSGQLTLWNQQGSHVRRGSLLVIPCGKALLYAEPIYLQAERSPMPELRLVVLALQDKLAYGTTFEAALASLFGGNASSLTATEAPQPSAPAQSVAGAPQPVADLNGLISEASRDFADYQRLTSEGKLGEAGQKLEQLKRALDKLNSYKK